MRNAIKTAAICGIITIAFGIFSGLSQIIFLGVGLHKASIGFSIFTGVIVEVMGMLFYYGFFVIGRRYDADLLKGVSVYLMFFCILMLLVSIPLIFYAKNTYSSFDVKDAREKLEKINMTYGGWENVPKDVMEKEFNNIFSPLFWIIGLMIIFYIFLFLFYGIPKILFGIGLLKVGKKIEYARITGILNIVAGATMIIFIGYFIFLVAFIFEIVLLFAEAEKKRIKQA